MKPQDNYTQIPNSILASLMSKELTSADKSVLIYIIRMTMGFHRSSYKISVRQFCNELKIGYRTAQDSLQKLQDKRLIRLINKGNSRFSYSEWSPLVQESALVQETAGVKANRLMQKSAVTHAETRACDTPVNKAILNKGIASNASKLSSWEQYGIPYLEEVGRGDDEFSARVKESYLRDGKYATKNAVLGFIDRELKSRPPEEYISITELIEGKEGLRG